MLWDYIDKRTANVYGIYGHLGGGKTLTAVEMSIFALKAGWHVSSNVFLKNLSPQMALNYTYIENFENQDFWKLPCGAPRGSSDSYRSVIVIDECAEFFDQFSSTSSTVKSFSSWLRHSSKRGQIVFLIVQQPEFIAKSLRLLIHKWIVCVDLAQFRMPILRAGLPFSSDYVWRRIFDRYGNLISRGFNLASKAAIGTFYDTAQSIAVAGRSNNYTPHENARKTPLDVFVSLALVLYIILLTMRL